MVFSKIGRVFGKGGDDGDRGEQGPSEARYESHHIEASQLGSALVVLIRCEHVSEREASIIY